jgi:6-pyruvoyltetrahydropterin/6-carboxytetrahydropterin synthase
VFEIIVESDFSSAHRLVNYDGDCSRVHGHNWRVAVSFKTESLDENGIGIDFRKAREFVEMAVARFDHYYLNELPEFQFLNPTCENIAQKIYNQVKTKLSGDPQMMPVQLVQVEVWESPVTRAIYRE